MAVSVSLEFEDLHPRTGATHWWMICRGTSVEAIEVWISPNQDAPVLREDQIIHDIFIRQTILPPKYIP
jgi:hypothetical protein